MLEHGLGLVVEPAIAQRGNQVAYGLALHTDVRGEHVVAHGQLAGDDEDVVSVEERGQGTAEFAHVDHDSRG